jgi:hypothetical protein
MTRTLTFAAALLAVAFTAQAQTAQPAAGVESEWDLKKMLDSLSAGARRLKPIMEQANPQTWRDAQAAQSYSAQWKSAQNQIQYLNLTADKLVKEPERLTIALETYFRLQALETSVSSLVEGIRKYQNPAVADLLQSALVENLNNRERLKTYLVELAQNKEQEFKIMDKEAQRCRAMISKQPPAPGGAKPRSK